MHNKKTGKYVLWMHIDSSNYGEAKAGVATGDQVCGKYTYIGSSQPLGFQSRDSSVFVDDDGKGYLLSEDVGIVKRVSLGCPRLANESSAKTGFALMPFQMTTSR